MTDKPLQSNVKEWVQIAFTHAKKELGITQSNVGEALGISQPAARELIFGNRKIQFHEIEILESLFQSRFGSGFSGAAARQKLQQLDAEYATTVPPNAAPLLSWVSAGALAKDEHFQEDYDDYPLAYAPELDPNGDWIALRVDGRSMDKISPHDSIIFVNRKEKNLVPNACYVILDQDGHATYKRYSPPNKFEPVSTKPEAYNSIVFDSGQEPYIIGRVRKTLLSL